MYQAPVKYEILNSIVAPIAKAKYEATLNLALGRSILPDMGSEEFSFEDEKQENIFDYYTALAKEYERQVKMEDHPDYVSPNQPILPNSSNSPNSTQEPFGIMINPDPLSAGNPFQQWVNSKIDNEILVPFFDLFRDQINMLVGFLISSTIIGDTKDSVTLGRLSIFNILLLTMTSITSLEHSSKLFEPVSSFRSGF